MMSTNQRESQLATFAPMTTPARSARSLAPEENERIRAVIRELLKTRTQQQLEAQSGISQQQLSNVANGGVMGMTNARRLAEFVGVPLDALLSGKEVRPELPLSSWPGWVEAADQVRSRFPGVAPYVDRAGRMRTPDEPHQISWENVWDLVNVLIKLDAK